MRQRACGHLFRLLIRLYGKLADWFMGGFEMALGMDGDIGIAN
jgi:hypothetical protein